VGWKDLTGIVQRAAVNLLRAVRVTYTPDGAAALPAFDAMFRDAHEEIELADADVSVMGVQLVLELQAVDLGQEPHPKDRLALEDIADATRFAGKTFRAAHFEQDGEGMLMLFLNEVSA
jgi:polyisoprenoid-binding protein YceI